MRPHDPGRPDQDQGRGGPHADLPPLLQGGHLRLLRHEHQREERPRLPALHRAQRQGDRDPAAAPHLRGEGLGARSHQLLQPIQVHRAVAEAQGREAEGRQGVLPEQGGPRQARRHVRVHPLRLLHDLLPVVLVEPRVLLGPRRVDAGIPVDCGLSRSVHGGEACLGQRHHEALPLPRHHELHQLLPQGPRPREGHRPPQGAGRRDLQGRLEGHDDRADLQEQGPRVRHDVHVRRGRARFLRSLSRTGERAEVASDAAKGALIGSASSADRPTGTTFCANCRPERMSFA
mmetsp:Transcript_32351/g.100887  ORF Transcript_32351/g.100887 Transcript_32351/m.100887 type:complete len:289 (+) Transcript_32351:285-1151(+)